MALKHRGKTLAAGLLAGALLGGGLAAITPAGAAVQGAAASIDWKEIWQTKIKPRADKRYYTKKKANARYYTKWDANALFETKAAHDASLGGYYTKAQSDANYYNKAASDARYAPYPAVIRGVFAGHRGPNAGETNIPINWGYTFATAPTAHFINFGDPLPAGCLGTVALPDAAPGHLCIFESGASNIGTKIIADGLGNGGVVGRFGGYILGLATTAANSSWWRGNWAVRPAVSIPNPQAKAPNGDGINHGSATGGQHSAN
jgi:hypothetical protein